MGKVHLRILVLVSFVAIVPLAGPKAQPSNIGRFSITENPDSAVAVLLESLEGEYITLSDALSLGVQNATAVREAEAGFRAARGALLRSKGTFDPVLSAGVSKTSIDQPVGSPFEGSEIDETGIETMLSMRFPTGTQLSARLQTSRIETNAPFSTLNPEYSATGALSVVQPLLSGFGPSASADMRASARGAEAAEAYYEDAVLAISATVENLYWDLYAAERDYVVQVLIREQAATLLWDTELRASAGLVGSGQVANARVFLEEQEQALLDRQEDLDRTSDGLAELIGKRAGTGDVRFRTIDKPISVENSFSLDNLLDNANRENRLVRSAEKNLSSVKTRYSGANWDRLPSLDLVGSVGGNGLSGSPRTVIFGADTLIPSISGSWSDAYESVISRDYPTWMVGLQLRLPLFRMRERGERDRLKAEVDRAEQVLVATQRGVENAVRASYRDLQYAQQRLEAAERGVDAAQEQVRVGHVEYRAGNTTAFELVRLVADHASAQQRYSRALVRTAKAVANLKRLIAEGIEN